MACFVVPVTEAIATTIATQVLKSTEKAHASAPEAPARAEKKIPFSRKLSWLNKMLWGGSALLAFEHIWHGEVTPWFPFLTAAGNPADAVQMVHEMSTAGVAMAALVTAVWLGVVAVTSVIEKQTMASAQSEGVSE